jgi:hypothetical protein
LASFNVYGEGRLVQSPSARLPITSLADDDNDRDNNSIDALPPW